MPSPQAKAITVSGNEHNVLAQIIRQPTQPQWLVTRSKIILGAAAGETISQQASELDLVRQAVRHWRERWEASHEERQASEDAGPVREGIEKGLRDGYRSGAPATFRAEQVVQIIAVACEAPHDSRYPIRHWAPKEVAQEVIKRGIVVSISERQVGRFLKRGGS